MKKQRPKAAKARKPGNAAPSGAGDKMIRGIGGGKVRDKGVKRK